jgi:archaellum component FlaC
MKAVEEEWQNYQIPDRKLIDKIEQDAKAFLATTKEIEGKQPFCHIVPQNYDQLFLLYKPQIENLTEQNSNLTRTINNYTKIKNYQLSISSDIENIAKTISRYESIPEAVAQVSQLKNLLYNLKLIQSQLDAFNQNQLSRFEELKTQLGNNFRLLEILKKPTHEFTSIKRENITIHPNGEPDPECPIKYAHKTSEYSSVEKCSKCGTKRKPTPFDIG